MKHLTKHSSMDEFKGAMGDLTAPHYALVEEGGKKILVKKSDDSASFMANELGDKTQEEIVSGPKVEMVDLGLPSGLKWANMNVGATSPEDAGLYFAWGETTGYAGNAGHNFDWANYKWSVGGSPTNFSKYNSTGATLELEDDAARANLGGSWRMPTKAEFDELIENANWTWTTNYEGTGKGGYIVKSKTNSNQIFMPAAGRCDGTLSVDLDSYGTYWSSSQDAGGSGYGWYLDFDSGYFYSNTEHRRYGQSVRGVCE